MVRILSIACGLVAAASLLPWTAPPAFAQAKAAAESNAAARKTPHWTPPKTAWGHPDLEGIWTTDDMRGVPMSRPPQFGDAHATSPTRSSPRARSSATRARDIDNARTGTFRNEEGIARLRLHLDGDRSARRPRAGADGRRHGPGRALQGSFGVGPWEKVQDFSLYDRCITRGADRLVHAGGLRQRRAHRPDAGLGGHQLRDGARHARHPARQPSAARPGHPALDGRLARRTARATRW